MSTLLQILIILLALEHVLIALFEMFAWTSEAARKASNLTVEVAQATRQLGINQGLYNLIFTVGFGWAAFFAADHVQYLTIIRVFGAMLLVVGVYGGKAFSKNIYFVQALPALLVLLLSFAI